MSESEKYEVLEKIGHGSFGIIRKVRRKADGMVVCRKEISYLKMSQKEREQLHAEFHILSTLRHPNIVGYYHREHLKVSQDLHLYMEYCGNGDLGRVIRELAHKNQYAEESFVWSVFSQLLTALYRCHYGVDPPEVGKTVLGLGSTAKPKQPTGGMTILHRDLKPENVFLGEDNSVKLGDFGLSKMIQSHDFASTYVGTPFYMSPEICAAEKYTLKSDVWSLGCIMYELCSREPPFNAKSHFQLVQKIKEGKIAPLPAVYSAELMSVIKDCLRVNPDRRPDTATLLNLPVVRLMRKEKEVADFSKMLKAKDEAINRRVRELDHKMSSIDADKVYMRQEIDSSLRREWEVKARLEIDRLVNQEMERLQKKFEQEVQARVEEELQRRVLLPPPAAASCTAAIEEEQQQHQDFSSSAAKSDYPYSSVGGGSFDGEVSSSATDMTELSIDSPEPPSAQHPLKKSARTPFARAQTMFNAPAGTPMDIEMASPSPITIASLSLSPRRNAATKVPATNPSNIFAAAAAAAGGGGGEARWDLAHRDHHHLSDLGSDSESDDEAPIPSPTRMIKSSKNPFTSKERPTLHAQKSAPVHRLQSKQTLAAGARTTSNLNAVASNPELPARSSNITGAGAGAGASRDRVNSPSRRLSKIPSTANLPGGVAATNTTTHGSSGGSAEGSGPQQQPPAGIGRKPSFAKRDGSGGEPQPPMLNKVVAKNNNIKGRTLVELQQARAGGRPVAGPVGADNSAALQANNNASPKRAFRDHASAAAAARGGAAGMLEPAAVWDPEKDEMPSPFLVRRRPLSRV